MSAAAGQHPQRSSACGGVPGAAVPGAWRRVCTGKHPPLTATCLVADSLAHAHSPQRAVLLQAAIARCCMQLCQCHESQAQQEPVDKHVLMVVPSLAGGSSAAARACPASARGSGKREPGAVQPSSLGPCLPNQRPGVQDPARAEPTRCPQACCITPSLLSQESDCIITHSIRPVHACQAVRHIPCGICTHQKDSVKHVTAAGRCAAGQPQHRSAPGRGPAAVPAPRPVQLLRCHAASSQPLLARSCSRCAAPSQLQPAHKQGAAQPGSQTLSDGSRPTLHMLSTNTGEAARLVDASAL